MKMVDSKKHSTEEEAQETPRFQQKVYIWNTMGKKPWRHLPETLTNGKIKLDRNSGEKKKYWRLVILEKIAWQNTDDQSKKFEMELAEKEGTREIEYG